MILADRQIKELMARKELLISPFNENQIGPTSVDLTLGEEKIEFDTDMGDIVDISKPFPHNLMHKVKGEVFDLNPKEFSLFHTAETIKLPRDIAAQLEGRSSIGRHGIFIHNAGFVDSGFSGQLTLELFNATNHVVRFMAGMRICQLVLFDSFVPVETYAERKSSKYQNQVGAVMSRLYKEGEVMR